MNEWVKGYYVGWLSTLVIVNVVWIIIGSLK